MPWTSQFPHWIGTVFVSHPELRQLERPLLGIVSSHLNHNTFASNHWQSALFSALSFAREQNATVLYSAASPYAAVIKNACNKTNLKSLRLALASSKLVTGVENEHNNLVFLTVESDAESADMQSLPYLDRVIIALAQQLFILDINPRGKIAKLAERRLHSPDFPEGSIFLVQSTRPQPLKKRRWIQSQLDQGAIGWFVQSNEHNDALSSCRRSTPYALAPIFSLDLLARSHSHFLVHCTRARQGAWPDQSSSQFYDELILNPWSEPPSALQSLIRILETQRLIATSHLKQAGVPTISFTKRTLHDLIGARTFETHLARWDWEPYGMMIDQDWLSAAGCKPVSYKKREELSRIPPEELPFTQPYEDADWVEKKGRDWRVEQEWRLAEDLRLHHIPFSKAIVFVKHKWEARFIAPLSNWPICYTDSSLS